MRINVYKVTYHTITKARQESGAFTEVSRTSPVSEIVAAESPQKAFEIIPKPAQKRGTLTENVAIQIHPLQRNVLTATPVTVDDVVEKLVHESSAAEPAK